MSEGSHSEAEEAVRKRSLLYRPAADQPRPSHSSWSAMIGFSITSEDRVEPGVMAVKKFENQSPFDTQYEIVANLGSGSFSTVYKCVSKNKRLVGSVYTVKEIDTAAMSVPQIRSIRFEMNVLSQLQKHENVVGIYGAYRCVFLGFLTPPTAAAAAAASLTLFPSRPRLHLFLCGPGLAWPAAKGATCTW